MSLPGPATLDAKDRKAYLRALLYPARLCFSYATGLMTSNDDAVAYLREQTRPASTSRRSNRRCNAAKPPPILIRCSICAAACPHRSTPARR